MNKLLAALVVCVFALGSVAAMSDDKTPAQPVDPAKLKAEKDAAKAVAKMTPEEKHAARKAARAKKLEDAATTPSGRRPDYDQLHRRYLEPLPPERWPVKREPAKSNP